MLSTIAILLFGCFIIILAVLALASATDGRYARDLATRPIRVAPRK